MAQLTKDLALAKPASIPLTLPCSGYPMALSLATKVSRSDESAVTLTNCWSRSIWMSEIPSMAEMPLTIDFSQPPHYASVASLAASVAASTDELTTEAVAETFTWPAAGSDVPPVAEIVTSPEPAGM